MKFIKRHFKKILWFLVITLIVIQFFPAEKNISVEPSPNHISKGFNVPLEVQNIFDKACNDCHSNNTVYPWYSKVQPVGWWLANHIEEGCNHLNFDEYATYSLRRQFNKFKDVKEQIEEDEMPLSSYMLIHRNAVLSSEEKQVLIKWSEDRMNEMKAKYPMDSLVRKQRRG